MGDRTMTQDKSIDPRLDAPSGAMIEALMGYAAKNPWDMEYGGPRLAAVNEQQKQVMDQTAGAGNAFNMGFTSARGSLPQETTMDGMQAYDALGQAKQGISSELQSFLSLLYGEEGPLDMFRLDYEPGADDAIDPFWNPAQPDYIGEGGQGSGEGAGNTGGYSGGAQQGGGGSIGNLGNALSGARGAIGNVIGGTGSIGDIGRAFSGGWGNQPDYGGDGGLGGDFGGGGPGQSGSVW